MRGRRGSRSYIRGRQNHGFMGRGEEGGGKGEKETRRSRVFVYLGRGKRIGGGYGDGKRFGMVKRGDTIN